MNRLQRSYASVSLSALLVAASLPVLAEQIKPVFQHELPSAAGKTMTVVEVHFEGGAKADAHRHGQAFVYAYVLSGSVRSELAGEPVQTYSAGQGWFEPPGARDVLTENVSRTTPARLLVVFIANPGEPLKTPDAEKESVAMPSTPNLASTPLALAAEPAPQQMVDALYSAFGDHHSRAVHAKGIMAVGTFEPTSEFWQTFPRRRSLRKAPSRSWCASLISRESLKFPTLWAMPTHAALP